MMASRLLSGQLPDQRSGTSVTARPDEQFGPNRPICNLLPEYIDRRAAREASWAEICGACTVSPRLTSFPSPLWGGVRGGGREVMRRRGRFGPVFAERYLPTPTLPSPQGGG